ASSSREMKPGRIKWRGALERALADGIIAIETRYLQCGELRRLSNCQLLTTHYLQIFGANVGPGYCSQCPITSGGLRTGQPSSLFGRHRFITRADDASGITGSACTTPCRVLHHWIMPMALGHWTSPPTFGGLQRARQISSMLRRRREYACERSGFGVDGTKAVSGSGSKGKKKGWVLDNAYPAFAKHFNSTGPNGPNIVSLKDTCFKAIPIPMNVSAAPVLPKRLRAVGGIKVFEQQYKANVICSQRE
ncbi:hypothetical protein AX14_004753, partial [Amanita brunnescens Koide BX004]